MAGSGVVLEGESEEEQIEELAMMVGQLIGLSALLIPHLDLLDRAAESARETSSITAAAAPIIGAMGKDWEESQFEADLQTKRSKAIVEMIRVLKETEDERAEFQKKQVAKREGVEQLRRMGIHL